MEAPFTGLCRSANRREPRSGAAILAEVSKIKPELPAFFACLYYAALRPEEAVTLRRSDLILPSTGWGS